MIVVLDNEGGLIAVVLLVGSNGGGYEKALGLSSLRYVLLDLLVDSVPGVLLGMRDRGEAIDLRGHLSLLSDWNWVWSGSVVNGDVPGTGGFLSFLEGVLFLAHDQASELAGSNVGVEVLLGLINKVLPGVLGLDSVFEDLVILSAINLEGN